MSFEERVNHRAVHYLLAHLSKSFLNKYYDPNDEEKLDFVRVRNILQRFKTDGIHVAKYKKSHLDTNQIFRSYGNGVQCLPSAFRGLLCNGLMTDIDMVNAFPTILLNICQQKNIPCNYLTQYCNERKELISKGVCTKLDVLKCINKKTKMKGSPWLMAFDTEIKAIQSHLILHYQDIYNGSHDEKNPTGTFMTRVCMYYENLFLEEIIKYVKPLYSIAVLMFDGFMVYGTPPATLLNDLHELLYSRFGFTLHFAFKEHNTSIVIPDDFVVTDEMTYEILKVKYETEYSLAYIVKTTSYSFKVGDVICFFNKEQINQTLFPIKIGKLYFFTLWCNDPTRQTFDDVGVYPHDVSVPNSIMNLWKGFAVERHEYPIVDIEPIFKHLRILMNHHEPSYVFMLKWLANLFQFPSSTSIFINLASKPGAGKSTFVERLLNPMLGSDKTAEITNLSNELFGTFNSQLRDAVLININEVESSDSRQCYERLKSQITSPTISVHGKGEKPYTIANLRKFISTNNNPHAIVLKENDRRYFSTECSDELIGNIEYFKEFGEFIKKPEVQYSFWKYLMNYETPKQLTVKDIPITNLMIESYKLNRDPIEDFADELETNVRLNTNELYTNYKQFMQASGLQYTLNAKQFAMKLKRAVKNRIINGGQGTDGRRFFILREVG